MDLGLNDRVFVVTAASSGLGYATAEQLVAEGAKVILVARREELLAERVATLGSENAAALPADLSDPEVPARACALALERFGRLDGAMISAGGPPGGKALENTDEQWRSAFESVFLAAVRTMGAVVEHGTADDLAIALVLSSSVKNPITGLAISNGLRPGLAMLVKQYADDLGPHGTRVLGLLPGQVLTERSQSMFAWDGNPEENRRAVEETIPLRRLADPEEFGRVAAFLLSPAASYLTGIMVPVDGGMIRSL